MNKTFTELGFKAGDTVVCVDTKRGCFYKKGDKFTLRYGNYGIVTDCDGFDGSFGEWKLVEKDMSKFKIGDKVKVIKRTGYFGGHNLDIGGVYKISEEHTHCGFKLKSLGKAKDNYANYVHVEEIEMYEQKPEFEDQWHLNDGKVEIPDDADKLEKDGSVVAFRKRKVKPFEFGEKLRIKKSLWKDHPKVVKVNQGLDYVDAVYISKYFDLDGVEGIKVYVNNGEKSWECYFTTLDKVERLT